MIKNVHLGFFINEYNKEPIWTELASFNDALELDRFMDHFYDDNIKIKKLFDQNIADYSIDNIGQFKKVSEIIDGNFKGRIAAYYFNERGQMEFLDLPTTKKKPIRDFRIIKDFNKAYQYLAKVFEDAVERVNKKYGKRGPTKGEFIHYICEKLHQSSYEVSENEVYYLAIYYMRQNEKNKNNCLTLLKTNIRRCYLERLTEEANRFAEDKRLARTESIIPEEKLAPLDSASSELQYDIQEANKEMDMDNIYLRHDLDELIRDTNVVEKGMKQR